MKRKFYRREREGVAIRHLISASFYFGNHGDWRLRFSHTRRQRRLLGMAFFSTKINACQPQPRFSIHPRAMDRLVAQQKRPPDALLQRPPCPWAWDYNPHQFWEIWEWSHRGNQRSQPSAIPRPWTVHEQHPHGIKAGLCSRLCESAFLSTYTCTRLHGAAFLWKKTPVAF